MEKKSMYSDEAPAKRVRRTMENDTPNFADDHEHPMKPGVFDIELDEDVLPMASRPEAPNVDAFMLDPYKYRPRDEYLAGALIIEDETVLTNAVKNQNVGAVATLLEAGADANVANKRGVMPISAAAHKGNTIVMRSLITAGANVNALNSSGSTALIQASHFGHVGAVTLLLNSQASADFANHKGTTALMRASQEGHLDISSLLIDAKADVNRKNHEGMNALMLASQRGHASMVHLLITKGAVMDEQTSQGSTALMLACKRGHEKCVEVLVSMGAEIYIRDTRGRTARDTATRRNFTGLLASLDTQVQIRRIQEYRRVQRTDNLMLLRNAHQKGRLRLAAVDTTAHKLSEAVKMTLSGGCSSSSASAFSSSSSSSLPSSSSSSRCTHDARAKWRAPTLTLDEAKDLVARPEHATAVLALTTALARPHTLSQGAIAAGLAVRPKGHVEWQWSTLLLRCMDLPEGLFEHIVDLLPLPRVWQWSLSRLRKRTKLAPHQAVLDMSLMMDEIFTDANLFACKDQRAHLVRISRNPLLTPALLEAWGITQPLLDSARHWADVQSLVYRTGEVDVTFRSPIARKMLDAASSLCRWYRHRCSSAKALGLSHSSALASGSIMDAQDDGMEATDAGGEEESQSDCEGGGEEEVMDQDTETELPGGADDAIDDDDDSDGEGEEGGHAPAHHHHHHHHHGGHNYGLTLGFGGF